MIDYPLAMEVQGHRGSRGTIPENTLPGFLAAIEAGADTLELDLLATRDGIVVIHHNYTVNKKLCTRLDGQTIEGDPLILSLTLNELKQLDCGSKRSEHFDGQVLQKGTLIPTLAELIELIQRCEHPNGKKIRLNLEIKREGKQPGFTLSTEEFAKKIVAVVEEANFSDRVYYSSFDAESLMAIKKLNPLAQIGFVFDEETLPIDSLQKGIEIAVSLGAVVISPHHILLTNKEDVALLQKHFRVIPWTVNEKNRWIELIGLGVDGLITDYPAALIEFLKKSIR